MGKGLRVRLRLRPWGLGLRVKVLAAVLPDGVERLRFFFWRRIEVGGVAGTCST